MTSPSVPPDRVAIITCDNAPLIAAVREAERLLESGHKFPDSFFGLIQSPGELVSVDSATTLGTDDIRIILNPSNRFADLIAALRASNIN